MSRKSCREKLPMKLRPHERCCLRCDKPFKTSEGYRLCSPCRAAIQHMDTGYESTESGCSQVRPYPGLR